MPEINAEGWCSCGLAANDPNHDAWCRLLSWNGRLFEDARFSRERQFEKDLEAHDYRHGRTPADPQGALAVQHEPAGKTYSR